MKIRDHRFTFITNQGVNILDLKHNDNTSVFTFWDKILFIFGFNEKSVYKKAYFLLGRAENWKNKEGYYYKAYTFVDNIWKAIKREVSVKHREEELIKSVIKTDTHEVIHCVLYNMKVVPGKKINHEWMLEKIGLKGL